MAIECWSAALIAAIRRAREICALTVAGLRYLFKFSLALWCKGRLCALFDGGEMQQGPSKAATRLNETSRICQK